LFLDISEQTGLKTVLVPIVIPGPAVMNPDRDKNVPFAHLVRLILKMFNLEKTIFFRGWVLGSYHRHAMIAVSSDDIRQCLIDNGISGQRIVVTGNPNDDKIFDILSLNFDEIQSSVYTSLHYPEDTCLIVYCTEVIQDIHGLQYLIDINRKIFETFNALPNYYRVVIKLHPRENETAKKLFFEAFTGERYRIVQNDTELLRLMRSAKVVISHYSAVLMDAALLGTTVLSIRILANEDIPIRFGEINPFIHIQSYDEVKAKCHAAVLESSFVDGQKKVIKQWIDNKGLQIDGQSSHRISNLIFECLRN
jgi:hypothetical protein